MGAASSAIDDERPIICDEATISWMVRAQREFDGKMTISDAELMDSAAAAIRAGLPRWMGGDLTAEQIFARQMCLDLCRDGQKALLECLTLLERNTASSRRCGSYRRTIFTTTKNVAVGDEIVVVHVYEIVPPIANSVTIYENGPKAILGEYVDGGKHF